MALVDKHKVKRQRLDRICEGKSQRDWRVLTRPGVSRPSPVGTGSLFRLHHTTRPAKASATTVTSHHQAAWASALCLGLEVSRPDQGGHGLASRVGEGVGPKVRFFPT